MNPIRKPVVALIWSSLILLAGPLRAAVVAATYGSATTVPVTAASYTATGSTVNFTLNFAPPTGTNLTVVKNTGLANIQGTFDNLAPGQAVTLVYGGVSYPFVANYSGGTGNDLVLQWANTRLLAWGSNSSGQLGNHGTTDGLVPQPVEMGGVLAGKTILASIAGGDSNLVLCADGTLAAWGGNYNGQLGNNTTVSSAVPVLVDHTGVLAGRRVSAVAAGSGHSLVLCADGSLATWGLNSRGQLGNATTTQSTVPVLVDRSGVLAGRTVVAICAGAWHNLALCADGSLAAWGSSSSGQLGNNTSTDSAVPVLVDRTGVLAGKTIVAIAAGDSHSLALCADGTLAAWGANDTGQLGNNTFSNSAVPVLVLRTGVLAGETATAIAAGSDHNFALCADGTLAGWGINSTGQLGDGGVFTTSSVPVLVYGGSALYGKTVTGISAGYYHSLARCADGSLVAWGSNIHGQLGDNTTDDGYLPVTVDATALRAGERVLSGSAGASHNLALVGAPPPPLAATQAATGVTDTAAALNGSVNAQGSSTAVTFEYGLTTSYGSSVAATPATASGSAAATVSATVGELSSGAIYHYRVVAASGGGTVPGQDMTFTTTTDASLAGLTLDQGSLIPAFSSANTTYVVSVPFPTSIKVTPVTISPTSRVRINGVTVASGTPSAPISFALGSNTLSIVVTAAGGANIKTYTLKVTSLPAVYGFASATAVPLTVSELMASGNTVSFALSYAPTPGTNLMVVNNTGAGPIQGVFDNLAQGQQVNLTYGGVLYPFIANYFGGTGNDLVLQWANTRLVAWGANASGQLGNNCAIGSTLAVPVDMSGVLAGKTVIAAAAGGIHNLVLGSDGTLYSWGDNGFGQLGNPATGSTNDRTMPVLVQQTSGSLAGKTVIAVAAGGADNLVLCSDGTMASWGYNYYGQLGISTTSDSNQPVSVTQSGVLAGKTPVAIAMAGYHALALCSDGSLAAWGLNNLGQLGNNATANSSVPVMVDRSGVLSDKTIIAIDASGSSSYALCSDGSVAAWGDNSKGQLGDGTTTSRMLPVLVDRSGVLAGKTVTAIGAGSAYGMALCSDGTVATWGDNTYGQLGNGTLTQGNAPLLVSRTGVLSGKTVTAISAGPLHSFALCSDGTLAAWGHNSDGQLGNNSTLDSSVPVLVSRNGLGSSERFMAMPGGGAHSLGLVASPPPPAATSLAATAVTDTGVTLNGSANAQGSTTAVWFEYGLTSYYGATVAASPASLTGATAAVGASVGGLSSATTYHYRVVATSQGGTVSGQDLTFTTSSVASLSNLTLNGGTLTPNFNTTLTDYSLAVPFASTTLSATPVVTNPGATVTVNGVPVASGATSDALVLAVGTNPVNVKVTAADGIITKTYQVSVTRLPDVYAFASATSVPVTVRDFIATGNTASLALNYAPTPGTDLTVVKNTGGGLIQGAFANLAQWQVVALTYGGVTYAFVANYYGGSGNDLVLQWANTRALAWGYNSSGQLGINNNTNSLVPVAVDSSGVLAGKPLAAVDTGYSHSLALCADGSLAAWGNALVNGTTVLTSVPVSVNRTGALAGKTVVAVAVGGGHDLALCGDGTLAAWGNNMYYGQLGNGSTADSNVPVLVNRTGVLAGKTITAIAAGQIHSLALCSDGTVAAWGSNGSGQLGNAGSGYSSVPVLVSRNGVLADKTVIAIAAGTSHSLALCSDGTLAAWGENGSGQLGDGVWASSNVPVRVDRTGVLAGKTVTAMAAGSNDSMAMCADGTVATWGGNYHGQLGVNSTTNSNVPVLVNQTGVLAGKTAVAISAGTSHCVARCADGTLAAWGANNYGQLGNNSTTDSAVPVLVNSSALAAGERFTALGGGYDHTLVLAASSPAPVAATLAATGITDTGATLNGSANALGGNASLLFEYGPTTSYGATLAATPATLAGTADTAASATLAGLVCATTYHYRLVVTSPGGTIKGADLTFTTSNLASLAGLTTSTGTLTPAFDSRVTGYSLALAFATTSISLTPLVTHAGATVTVGGVAVAAGAAGGPLDLTVGNSPLDVKVTAADGIITMTYRVTVTRLPETYVFNSAASVPVTVSDLVASGLPAAFALNYAPAPGTSLTVVRNTGMAPIQGTFANLAQWQPVPLTYGGISYPFVANYFGGTGNDLVLQWANNRAVGWGGGYANGGQLGNGSTTTRLLPVPVDTSGVLLGKGVVALSASYTHSLCLCADGTVAGWGSNGYGELGDATNTSSAVPVLLRQSGELAGRTVIAISAGNNHSLALCSDGAVVAWGYNTSGQLGTGNNSNCNIPTRVNPTGVLAGKTVIAIAAGGSHSLVLCADGSLAAWGTNAQGQLGNNSSTNSNVPVLVDRSGVLFGKTVTAIAAGSLHNLALCADGTVVSWGYNYDGQLGNKSTLSSSVPVWVDRTGVLAGKTVTSVAAGSSHNLAVCSDGTLAAWGDNIYGKLGNNGPYSSNVPVAVVQTGVLAGKTVVNCSAGDDFSAALCADGTLAAWGNNYYGELGNNSTTTSSVPVLVSTSGLASGESFAAVEAGYSYGLGLVASPPPPAVTSLAATAILDTGATLNASVSAQGNTTAVSFEYGLTAAYGTTVAAVPASLTGTAATATKATLGGLLAGTIYHYRVVATSVGGTLRGDDMTFTTSTLASLANLTLGSGTLYPAFSSINTTYVAAVPFATTSITLTPVCVYPTSTVKVNNVAVVSGSASGPLSLAVGNTTISIVVTAAGGSTTQTYSVTVTRLPQTCTFSSATAVPVAVGEFLATGLSVSVALSYAPTPGTSLTMVSNTGPNPIHGSFDNLAQGQVVTLSYGGVTYAFAANYYGGTGNDLVLQWASTRLQSWGTNANGELGNNSTTNSSVAVPVNQSGALAGKALAAISTGASHSLALCTDGTLAAWGYNNYGQLGIGTATSSTTPVLVNTSGVLAGKTVVAISAGSSHNLVLCTDGTLVAWGYNNYGQLGNSTTINSSVPVLVDRSGVLAGKTPVAIAAGSTHSLALCADGSVAAWGYNGWGLLGNNSTTNSSVPVLVNRSGVLAGKSITAIAAGGHQSLALCSDRTVAAWGDNSYGSLGNDTVTTSSVPMLVNQTGVLAGKTVVALSAGSGHTLALCSDGTVAAWGYNSNGQLGNSSTSNYSLPVLVNQSGALSGKTVVALSAGLYHSMALCSDGTLAAWGGNASGQLGEGSTTQSTVPVAVSASGLAPGERIVAIGAASAHSLALVASPPPPQAATLAATAITDTGATLNGSLSANGSSSGASFEYGLTSAYGAAVTATPATLTGTTVTAAKATLSGLIPGTTYHYRAVASRLGTTVNGADMTFTTTTLSYLSSLTLSGGTLAPAFDGALVTYSLAVPFATTTLTATPVAANPGATVKVNAVAVASGATSGSLSLTPGDNPVSIEVTSADGVNKRTYTVTVTRLPQTYIFNSATTVPVTVKEFVASGMTVDFALNFAPPPGTALTAVKNTGFRPIQGSFANLAQGQVVHLTYGGISYAYVVNYFGGSGNDLVLQWANTRLLAWGYNGSGQLGNTVPQQSTYPTPVDMTGVLAAKSILSIASGSGHNLALCSDGTLAAWGTNSYGQLGDNSTVNRQLPVAVDRSGALAGKTVVAVSTWDAHSLALCADGALAAWGYNNYGQLGNNTRTNSSVPVLVDMTGVLAGKTVTAIAAGGSHNLVLCTDGTLVAWGDNTYGQLGNGSTTASNLPVVVNQTGVLAGKTIIAVTAGYYHNLALCSDGTLAAWGSNDSGQLGSGGGSSSVPVLVIRSGVLAGKTVVAACAATSHSLALCSDGTMAAWGYNANGLLGNGGSNSSTWPVAVTQTGVLSGKTVINIAAGSSHSLALCSDGTMAAWGFGGYGQLGNDTTNNTTVPLLVSSYELASGERYLTMDAGVYFSLALVASPPPPAVTMLAATAVTDTSATLNANVNAEGNTTTMSFQFGLTTSYGTTLAPTPATLTGATPSSASVPVTGLLSGTTYHYRLVATNSGGTVAGDDMAFTTSTYGTLTDLSLSSGALAPAFAGAYTTYIATVPYATSVITATPVAAYLSSTVKINGLTVSSGTPSAPINLPVGDTQIAATVSAADGINAKTYMVTVTRLPETFTFNSATDVPVSVADFLASGNQAGFALNYAPVPGTNLTVVRNTGPGSIRGTFDNLAQGQTVKLNYGGVIYDFVANYHGGTGNDLVLQWANTRLLAWGANTRGQLGNNTLAPSTVPVPVDMSGVLAGKTVIATAVGTSHSLALCTDGSVATWGSNGGGQLGNNSYVDCLVPVSLDTTGVLAGKQVIAAAIGDYHSLVLCADGTLAGWGSNYDGQLGNNSTNLSSVPVLVTRTGALAGKTVIAVAAGSGYSLALCSDGTMVAWGYNGNGQLGNNTTAQSNVPVLVNQTGVLSGKTVVAIAAGAAHNLALCADGTLAAWGYNGRGQLGNSSTTNSSVPVLVDRTGVLSGKTIIATVAGDSHSLALCADGTLAAWGYNANGQLGINSTTNSLVPVLVNTTGVISDRSLVAISAGSFHSLALAADGRLAAWGSNNSGQLGNSSSADSKLPLWVDSTALRAGERIAAAALGAAASHALVLVASPPPPAAATFAATAIADTAATLNGTVNANGSSTAVSFDYGLTTSYGASVAATPGAVAGTTTTAASARPGGLLAGTTYHYRALAASGGGTVPGADMTFTTTDLASLSGLLVSDGTLYPAFASINTSYIATLPFGTSSIALTPVCKYPTAAVKVNDVSVASGSASQPVSLAVGNNVIRVVVAADDVSNTETYFLTVYRLPQALTFNSATDQPITVGDFLATGPAPGFALNYAPTPGTVLTVVNNTGTRRIQGTFDRLAQGQVVRLTYQGVSYAFAADYSGGTGNDLVLHWANTRLLAWGFNLYYGTLGNNSTTNSSVAVPVDMSGVLSGKTIIATAAGDSHSLALCADGTLAAWGDNSTGQLGSAGVASSAAPVLVDQSGVLAGKTVIAIAAGAMHNLALCSDGTVAAWGYNGNGRLGNNSTTNSSVPVLVDNTGVLAGKRACALAAGSYHSLALCADGTLVAWGSNSHGQLGNGRTTDSSVPVAVALTGALGGRTVTAINTGIYHSLARCADGTVVAWGANSNGQLGNNSTSDSALPVLVDQTGVLVGKTVSAITSGGYQNVCLCTDGTLAAWGYNSNGQLGNGTTTQSNVPVRVTQTGVLAGESVVAACAGGSHNLALCADGLLATWGYNYFGQLGNNSTTQSPVPVWVDTSGLVPGLRFVAAAGGTKHSLALAAYPLQTATALPATAITGISGTVNGSVNAIGNATTAAFEYGLNETYGNTMPASPAAVTGTSDTAVSAALSGLTPGTTYHYRVVASSFGGTVSSADMTFTTLSDNAKLAALRLSAGAFGPDFAKTTTSYVATVPYATDGVTVTPVTDHPAASVQVEGVPVASGAASGVISLAVGDNTITTWVTAEDGITTKSYTITVTRLPLNFAFNSAGDVPVSANGFAAGGIPVDIVLKYVPLPGTNLMMVRNTGLGFIYGNFGNLTQGQRVTLNYAGKGYDFVANYYGGSGNDLVLQWAATKAVAWGSNSYGQLGDNTTTRRLLPGPIGDTGALANKTITAVAEGYLNSLALCSDGTLAAWGYNVYGQLGNNSAAPSCVPVAVDSSGALAGKTVIAISAGPFHNLALCSDGSVAAWGYNNYGQLGTGDKVTNRMPVLVNPTGALAGKHVVAVAAAAYGSFALCDDGALAAWGYNDEGELGDGTMTNRCVPVAVNTPAGLCIASIAAGQYHTLALCTDGTLLAWGYNNRGQLGNGGTDSITTPAAIGGFGALAGKSVAAIRASGAHSLALCADGTLAAWGWNNNGQLGLTGMTQSSMPVAVNMAGAGLTQIAIGGSHSLALSADGTLAACGDNAYGQLGTNSMTPSAVPLTVDPSGLAAGARWMAVASGSAALHNIAVVGLPAVSIAPNAGTDGGAQALLDRAFGLHLDPTKPGQLPQGQRIGGDYVIQFTQPAGVTGVTYGAEWSATLQPGSWIEVPDMGAGETHIFSVPAGTDGKLFMRLKVTGR